jgi:demethylmenaquinone methyltransferase / 2-methoxy-6-polyprenyl-1,4-benzoquinol methylase
MVEAMFNDIAPRYDFLNHVLSLGIDKLWRKRLINGIVKHNPENVLDMATGTADLAIALAQKSKKTSIVGIDISENMLSVGIDKVNKLKLSNRIGFTKASSENIPIANNTFDAAMVAFGVRNFENPLNGLKEMFRVIKPGGTINVLEFTTPRLWLVRFFYQFYFKRILPWVGRKISGHKTAYTYLPNSVAVFKERQDFLELLMEAGFVDASFRLQSFGIAAIYRATKLSTTTNYSLN